MVVSTCAVKSFHTFGPDLPTVLLVESNLNGSIASYLVSISSIVDKFVSIATMCVYSFYICAIPRTCNQDSPDDSHLASLRLDRLAGGERHVLTCASFVYASRASHYPLGSILSTVSNRLWDELETLDLPENRIVPLVHTLHSL